MACLIFRWNLRARRLSLDLPQPVLVSVHCTLLPWTLARVNVIRETERRKNRSSPWQTIRFDRPNVKTRVLFRSLRGRGGGGRRQTVDTNGLKRRQKRRWPRRTRAYGKPSWYDGKCARVCMCVIRLRDIRRLTIARPDVRTSRDNITKYRHDGFPE